MGTQSEKCANAEATTPESQNRALWGAPDDHPKKPNPGFLGTPDAEARKKLTSDVDQCPGRGRLHPWPGLSDSPPRLRVVGLAMMSVMDHVEVIAVTSSNRPLAQSLSQLDQADTSVRQIVLH